MVLSIFPNKSYIKTNMIDILHRIKATSLQPLENFKDMLTTKEYLKYKSNAMRGKTWYPLTPNVFDSFLFSIEHSALFIFHNMY